MDEIKAYFDDLTNDELETFINEHENVNSKKRKRNLELYHFYSLIFKDRKENGISFERKYYSEGGDIRNEEWHLNGDLHRSTEDGPALICYYQESRKVKSRSWHLNGDLHRPTEDGPAEIEYYDNGNIRSEKWFLNGILHRPTEDGPAIKRYHKNGAISSQDYCEYGNEVIF